MDLKKLWIRKRKCWNYENQCLCSPII